MSEPFPTASLVLRLLDNPATKNAIRREHGLLFASLFGESELVRDIDEKVQAAHLHVGFGDCLELACADNGPLGKLINERVISRIPLPRIVSCEDIAQQMRNALHIAPRHFEVGYQIFLGNVDRQVLKGNESIPFAICQAIIEKYSVDEDHNLVREDLLPQWYDRDLNMMLWSKNEIIVQLVVDHTTVDVNSAKPGRTRGPLISAKVTGIMSDGVCQAISRQLRQTVPTIIRSITTAQVTDGLAQIDRKSLEESLPVIQICIESLLGTTSKNTIRRRVRNAILLLAEVDQQLNDAVALALAMAAIEALICEKDDDITEALSEITAAILEPEAKVRPRAERFMRRLYGRRSDILHGRSIAAEHLHRLNARFLAGCTLRAVLERITFRNRYEESKSEESFEAFREAVKNARDNLRRVDYVTDSPARSLWLD